MNSTDLVLRLKSLLFHDRAMRDLDEELSAHLEMQTQREMRNGLSREDASAPHAARSATPLWSPRRAASSVASAGWRTFCRTLRTAPASYGRRRDSPLSQY